MSTLAIFGADSLIASNLLGASFPTFQLRILVGAQYLKVPISLESRKVEHLAPKKLQSKAHKIGKSLRFHTYMVMGFLALQDSVTLRGKYFYVSAKAGKRRHCGGSICIIYIYIHVYMCV